MLPDSPVSGLLLVNKPRGMTSFKVVSCLRKMTGIRRIGHTGTLDPFADGLLPIVIGRATAVVRFMEKFDKVYELVVEFGRTTDTLDITGKTKSICPIDEERRELLRADDYLTLREAVAGLQGKQVQVPPMYSAVKVNGRPLYTYARKGEEIERSGRPVQIYRASILSINDSDTLRARLVIHCSKGTYIRCLADDLGKKIGTGAVAEDLTRLSFGPFKIEEAWDLEKLQSLRDSCEHQQAFYGVLIEKGILLPISRALETFPVVDVPKDLAEDLMHGKPVRLAKSYHDMHGISRHGKAVSPETGLLAIYSCGKLIAVARLLEDDPGQMRLKTERVLMDLADFRQT